MDKEGGFVNRPLLLDGSNYDYWKSRMSAFLKSIDNKTWKAVLKGWEHPVALDKVGNKTTVLKLEEEWTTAEEELTLGNSKVLNALFNGVDKNMFRLIKQCTVAMDAREILKTAHEGTSKVKSVKLQLLITKFENMKMQEDENIQDYYMNILDIANSFDSLGEKLTDEKLVRKILRSLPKRFDMKVTAIEEARDIPSMKIDELIGSLQNFEIVIINREEKKEKSIAFILNDDAKDSQEEYENDERLSEAIVLFGKPFNKILKQDDWRSRSNGQNIRHNIREQQDDVNNAETNEKRNQFKGIQCHECDGYGHIRTECATFLKKQKKKLAVSWSDGDQSEEEGKIEQGKHVAALTRRVTSDAKTYDEELTYDKLATSYEDLYVRSAEICNLLEEQKKINNQLITKKNYQLAKISELNDQVNLLNFQLENVKKQVKMMTTSTSTPYDILEGQVKEKPNGIGFN